jgi:hypothetical protein
MIRETPPVCAQLLSPEVPPNPVSAGPRGYVMVRLGMWASA